MDFQILSGSKDKPSLSLAESRGQRAAEGVYVQEVYSVRAPLGCKTCAVRPFFSRLPGELGGSRSENLLEGTLKQILVQGHILRLQNEAREPGISRTETRKPGQSAHAGSSHGALSLIYVPFRSLGSGEMVHPALSCPDLPQLFNALPGSLLKSQCVYVFLDTSGFGHRPMP